MTKMNHGTCACCGSDITAPQFHDGKAYGYTCITKVAPGKKRTKKTFSVVDPDTCHIKAVAGTTRIFIGLRFNGEVLKGHGYGGEQREYQEGDTFNAIVTTKETGYTVSHELVVTENDIFISDKPIPKSRR